MRDTPKPNLEYKTKTKSQWRARTIDDCTWFAGGDAWEYVSHGTVHVFPEAFRKKHTGDISGPSQLRTVLEAFEQDFPAAAQYIQSPTQVRLTIDDCIDRLIRGAYLIVLGDYINLPKYYRRWTYNDNFQHATGNCLFNPDVKLFKGSRGSTWFYDPLGGGANQNEYEGEWIAVEWLFNDFAWHTGTALSVGVVSIEEGDTVITVAKTQEAPRKATVKANTKVYKEPTAAANLVKTLKNEQDLFYIGPVNSDWHAIVTHVDNADALKIAYIHKANLKTIITVPETPSDAELMAQVQALTKTVQEKDVEIAKLTTRVNTANGRLGRIDKDAVPV